MFINTIKLEFARPVARRHYRYHRAFAAEHIKNRWPPLITHSHVVYLIFREAPQRHPSYFENIFMWKIGAANYVVMIAVQVCKKVPIVVHVCWLSLVQS